MVRIFTGFLVWAGLCAQEARAQNAETGTLVVLVLDEDGFEVHGSTVTVVQILRAAMTDKQGVVVFEGVPVGTYDVNVESPSMYGYLACCVPVKAGSVTEMELVLDEIEPFFDDTDRDLVSTSQYLPIDHRIEGMLALLPTVGEATWLLDGMVLDAPVEGGLPARFNLAAIRAVHVRLGGTMPEFSSSRGRTVNLQSYQSRNWLQAMALVSTGLRGSALDEHINSSGETIAPADPATPALSTRVDTELSGPIVRDKVHIATSYAFDRPGGDRLDGVITMLPNRHHQLKARVHVDRVNEPPATLASAHWTWFRSPTVIVRTQLRRQSGAGQARVQGRAAVSASSLRDPYNGEHDLTFGVEVSRLWNTAESGDRGTDVGVFIQDSWKPGSELTVNFGTRLQGTHTWHGPMKVLDSWRWAPRLDVAWDSYRWPRVVVGYGRFIETARLNGAPTRMGSAARSTVEHGALRSPYTDEVLLGVEREVRDVVMTSTVSARFTRGLLVQEESNRLGDPVIGARDGWDRPAYRTRATAREQVLRWDLAMRKWLGRRWQGSLSYTLNHALGSQEITTPHQLRAFGSWSFPLVPSGHIGFTATAFSGVRLRRLESGRVRRGPVRGEVAVRLAQRLLLRQGSLLLSAELHNLSNNRAGREPDPERLLLENRYVPLSRQPPLRLRLGVRYQR